jgi:hypothetical protein
MINNIKKHKKGEKSKKHKKGEKSKKHKKGEKSEKHDYNVFFKNKNVLVLSSFIFITNIITSILYKDYTYSVLFLFLIITSVIYHSNSNIYTNILDKISIFLIVAYGSYNLNKKFNINNIIFVVIIIITFLLTIFLYIYGYFTNQFCFNSQKCVGNKYHCLLHFITAFGHNLIIIM